jgi:hypothetical protein
VLHVAVRHGDPNDLPVSPLTAIDDLAHLLARRARRRSTCSAINCLSTMASDLPALVMSRSVAGSRAAAISPSKRLASARAVVGVSSPCRPMVMRRVRPSPPSEPILHEVNLAARGRNFESEARKVTPPDFESGGWRFEPCRARQLANSTANTLGAIGCATRKGGRRQTCRPSLLRRRLHSLRALLAGLIPMHAGLFAGGLGLWRSER